MISEDIATSPVNIVFNDTESDTDITTLTQIETVYGSYNSNSSNVVPMGSIGQAKFLWIKPTADVQMLINGSVTPIVAKAGKASKLWTLINSLTIVVPTQTPSNPVPVTIVLAG